MGHRRTRRGIRTIAVLGCLSLSLTACDTGRVLELLDARLVDHEPMAADVPAGPTATADRAGDDPAGARSSASVQAEWAEPAVTAGDEAVSVIERQIFDQLNVTRLQAGLDALVLHAGISVGAREWSCEMARTGDFHHADLPAAGVSGENIAWGQRSAAEVHAAWMDSPGHRDNRLNARWTEYGIGACTNGSGQLHTTERFR